MCGFVCGFVACCVRAKGRLQSKGRYCGLGDKTAIELSEKGREIFYCLPSCRRVMLAAQASKTAGMETGYALLVYIKIQKVRSWQQKEKKYYDVSYFITFINIIKTRYFLSCPINIFTIKLRGCFLHTPISSVISGVVVSIIPAQLPLQRSPPSAKARAQYQTLTSPPATCTKACMIICLLKMFDCLFLPYR